MAKKRTAPAPGKWEITEHGDRYFIIAKQHGKAPLHIANIEKNEIYPGQSRAIALCMAKSKDGMNLLKHIRDQFSDDGNPVNFGRSSHPIAREIDKLLEDFEKEGIMI